ncbi:MAG: hypothetical protein IJ111_02915 [Eggerthellaceae bacterium]|nr:hypothetical protein [Eggerthellaceae bacterium]
MTIDTDAFYQASREANYVKVADIARNIAWTTPTKWGDLQITINLSKPEKDPRAIAAAAKEGPSEKPDYVDPATGRVRPCPLCVTEGDVECGYAKRLDLAGDPWGLWYSPYAYYNEHCIAMSWEHRPMHIDRAAFESLFDVVDALPQYFFGSNADLPIVGGSILSHDHYQGGRHTFPMEVAPISETFELPGYPDIEAGIVKWPLSVIRLRSSSRSSITDAASHILEKWVTYNDYSVGIDSGFDSNGLTELAKGEGAPRAVPQQARRKIEHHPWDDVQFGGLAREDCLSTGAPSPSASGQVKKIHNTITPIVRMKDGQYEMDLALRCNITSDEHPLGVFHPHAELHHVKKENIGLIEVMGMAILPPRLQRVMEERGMSRDDVGETFAKVLEHAGVFKWDDQGRAAFHRFIEVL